MTESHPISLLNYNKAKSAYRRNNSTESALLRTLDTAYNAMDSDEGTSWMLEISDAFNMVVHATLPQRLHTTFDVDDNIL